jgi:DNA-binding MarR family transcriptional regulator
MAEGALSMARPDASGGTAQAVEPGMQPPPSLPNTILGGDEAGADLAILITVAFRCVVDQLTARLAAAGFPDVRPPYGYIFRALQGEGMTSTELAALLQVSKQATLKLVDELEAHDFVARHPDIADRRAKILRLTVRGRSALETAMGISADLEAELAALVGDDRVASMRSALVTFIASHGGLEDARARRARPVW